MAPIALAAGWTFGLGATCLFFPAATASLGATIACTGWSAAGCYYSGELCDELAIHYAGLSCNAVAKKERESWMQQARDRQQEKFAAITAQRNQKRRAHEKAMLPKDAATELDDVLAGYDEDFFMHRDKRPAPIDQHSERRHPSLGSIQSSGQPYASFAPGRASEQDRTLVMLANQLQHEIQAQPFQHTQVMLAQLQTMHAGILPQSKYEEQLQSPLQQLQKARMQQQLRVQQLQAQQFQLQQMQQQQEQIQQRCRQLWFEQQQRQQQKEEEGEGNWLQ
eukprot:TRINITY_DN32603_c2_g1_i1.p1 TRINITY_DN32603_c2_g1~~TRINITY_DN32603_c2_g1_i1.p1  ORF type:complete len:290 (-),score=70.20 TRINITY_DN32603_c2_g1_i1:28-864(-)